ncbi:RNA 2'-phosphotransferase [Herbiconiux ginsengi]|uniref:Probable RNA 2'-phosphotransferase n=1 Tax=Herbiconiux ginsengi TaxID=381665 RepID=A0A1H3N5F8_9MICO|nr:RNA 2'-phosphotransferase [Herbiconiux ginsengi]SDY83984.1 putative RNA 2'-phosphotransferase [Herbiconiux ginsengi]
MKSETISRAVSHALRHAPEQYGLELDAEGWVPVSDLVDALRRQGVEWSDIDAADVQLMIETSAKRRHELRDGRIRAFYGHSVATAIQHTEARPPAVLFHGTSPDAWAAIRLDGLRPMARQNVHLAADLDTAILVGRRKAPEPIVLEVDTVRALDSGSQFWLGNDSIWLSDFIAAQFIVIHTAPHRSAR